MLEGEIITILQQSLIVTLKIAAPILIMSMAVGLFVSIIQTTTSIQEQTLTFVPKLFAIFLALGLFFTFILHTITNYTRGLFDLIVKF